MMGMVPREFHVGDDNSKVVIDQKYLITLRGLTEYGNQNLGLFKRSRVLYEISMSSAT